jgi:hypothetical protein
VEGSTGDISSSFGTGYIMNPAPSNAKSDDTIFPAKNLGKAVKPSATESFGPKKTGGAAGTSVSVGVMLGGLAAAFFFM